MEPLFFWIFAIGAVVFALSVILNRNPVASALSLVVSMLFLACLFFLLRAFLLGTIQILVYAGAVMVLFLFIIMLLDLKSEQRRPRSWIAYVSGLALAFFLAVIFFKVLGALPQGAASSADLPEPPGYEVQLIGNLLFTEYLLPFEVVGVLLLVGTLGVVLLSRKSDPPGASADGNPPPQA